MEQTHQEQPHQFGIKKRIYVLTVISTATLILLTALFLTVLGKQRALLHDIRGQHFAKIAALSKQFSQLSNNHVRLVDLLTSNRKLSDDTLHTTGFRILSDLNDVLADLQSSEAFYGSNPQDLEAYRSLMQYLEAYRNSAAVALRLASSDSQGANRRLRTANRNFRRISGEYEQLIQSARWQTQHFISVIFSGFDFQTSIFMAGAIAIVILLTILSLIMVRNALRDLGGITSVMRELVEGKKSVRIPGLERRDEVGEMARALAIFQVSHDQIDELADLEQKERHFQSEIASLKDNKAKLEARFNDLKDSVKELNASRDDALARNRAKLGLMGTVSYDIRTPMNGVLGMAGMLAQTDLSGKQREYVDAIRSSGESLLSVVTDLTDFSKLEALRAQLERDSFDILSVVDDLSDRSRYDVAQDRFDIAFHIAQDVPQFVAGDRKHLTRALSGLVRNLIQTEAPLVVFELAVEAHDKGCALMSFDLCACPDQVGLSLPLSIADRSWTQETLTADRLAGHGLGVAIAARVATLMGGALELYRGENGSTRWRFTGLVDIAESEEEYWLAPLSQLVDRRALIIDADPLYREVLRRQLADWGVSADHVADGRTALARLARAASDETVFDVVLIDQDLEDMNGIAFLRAMRSASDSEAVRAILYGRSGDFMDADEHAELGVSACLERPITPRTLFNTLVSVVSGGTAENAAPNNGEAAENAPAIGDDGRTARILLVDDNQMNQKVVSAMLTATDHSVDIVTNGLEALDALKENDYDVILMDIQMPEMDGVTATKEIRAMSGRVADIPIIALTANAMEGDREKYLSAGMNDYISKPIDRHTLIDMIARYMPSRSAEEKASKKKRKKARRSGEDAATGT